MRLALADANAGYEDAGVVCDVGPASSFTGVTFTGTGPLTAKVWITDGSEAFSPGMHAVSDGFDFTYGSDKRRRQLPHDVGQPRRAGPHYQSDPGGLRGLRGVRLGWRDR